MPLRSARSRLRQFEVACARVLFDMFHAGGFGNREGDGPSQQKAEREARRCKGFSPPRRSIYVPIYAASKERSLEEIRSSLSDLVRNFDADASGNRRLIRDLLDND